MYLFLHAIIFVNVHLFTMTENQEQTSGGARARVPTEKGLEYQITVAENKLKGSMSTWRRDASRLSVLISDESNILSLRQQRDLIQNAFENLCTDFKHISDLKSDINLEASKFESIEEEHQRLMQEVSASIREIERQAQSELGSSKSKMSGRSNTSRASEAAARRAVLKAELKYIDLESKSQADLMKIKKMKEIEMAEAEYQTLQGFKVEDQSDFNLTTIPKLPKHEFVKSYISSQSDSKPNCAPIQNAHNSPVSIQQTQQTTPIISDTPNTCTLHANSSALPFQEEPMISQSYIPSSVHFDLNPNAPTFTSFKSASENRPTTTTTFSQPYQYTVNNSTCNLSPPVPQQ